MTVPAPSILNPPAGVPERRGLKVAATVLQPLCLGEPCGDAHSHAGGGAARAPELNQSGNATHVMTAQGPCRAPSGAEHGSSTSTPAGPAAGSPGPLAPSTTTSSRGPGPRRQLSSWICDPSQPQEPHCPSAVLHNLFPAQGARSPLLFVSPGYAPVPPAIQLPCHPGPAGHAPGAHR